MVAWYWIPVALFVGALFGVFLTVLCIAHTDNED